MFHACKILSDIGSDNTANLFARSGRQEVNPYIIILILFIVGGLGMTFWGWSIIARGKKTLRWPAVEGVIEKSQPSSEGDDLQPNILFGYTVSGRRYERNVEYPSGTNPTPMLADSYVAKYPQGTKVRVYYDPARPEQATLEPGPARDDWFIFILGVVVTIIGIGFVIFSN
jgi:hypothetical protein